MSCGLRTGAEDFPWRLLQKCSVGNVALPRSEILLLCAFSAEALGEPHRAWLCDFLMVYQRLHGFRRCGHRYVTFNSIVGNRLYIVVLNSYTCPITNAFDQLF